MYVCVRVWVCVHIYIYLYIYIYIYMYVCMCGCVWGSMRYIINSFSRDTAKEYEEVDVKY